MDPPSYDDACVVPRLSDNQATNIPPPPSYNACITPSLPPPPTYREAVTTPLDPFPLLIPPRAPTSVTSPPNSDTVVHPLTEIGVTLPVRTTQTRPASVVTTQPRPVPISPAYLTELSGVVSCPFCQQVVSSKVIYVPGRTAWGMCVILAMLGLFCGFCLIPFMVRSLHDVHHYCPQCKRLLHVHKR
ncbi:lipopolysaccharide-induced tumor necrosis factor-alpha factor homolog isoform X1 [Takifugu flavidus]|uniref:LITAF domain-containing protein n=1 Tax=Takifugu flavidus TaxID=433684 RepID=A0A5C6MUD4_9TELE|nr:lipopolysaccharide-induced tumor necrosis factor-alpha factor homolog isoform X1 [Takifugu flavidus]TWW58852.1 hypothetical protein D4764_06G0003820 [Takifugu flavidus]